MAASIVSILPSARIVPLRRCNDCVHHLGDTLTALRCPRFGMPRHNVETRCAQFRAKVLQPIPRPDELIQALGNALAAVDLARRHSPSALGNVLEVMTEQARATYARVRS